MNELARWVLEHKRLVVFAWVVLALAGAGTASLTTSRLGKTFNIPGHPSYDTDARIRVLYRGTGGGQDPTIAVITVPAGQTVTEPGVRSTLLRAESAASEGGRYRVLGFASTHDLRFITRDRRSTFLLVFTPLAGFGSTDPTPAITSAVRAQLPAGWSELTTGTGQLQSSTGQSGGFGVFVEALLGGLGALVVLAVVFGSGLAILPLLSALVAIPTTFLLLLGLTTVTSINFVVQFLIGLIGLGVSIDYSLLLTTRWREEMARSGPEQAVIAAMDTAGHAVAFSGVTVAIGLLALVILPVPFLHSMGYGGVLIPLVSAAVALTLLPVCLATIGARLDRHRLRKADSASVPWMRWARFVARHRAAAAVAGTAIVAVLIVPVFTLNVGAPLSGSLTRAGAAHAGLARLEAGGVPTGVLDPMEVLVTRPADAAALSAKLATIPGVWTAVAPNGPSAARGGTALVVVLPAIETGAPGGTAVIDRV